MIIAYGEAREISVHGNFGEVLGEVLTILKVVFDGLPEEARKTTKDVIVNQIDNNFDADALNEMLK